MTIEFHTPPGNQGQIVEYSYALTPSETVIQCRYDRSDRSTTYLVGAAKQDDEGEYWNGFPGIVGEWREPTANERRKYDVYDCVAEIV